MQFNLSRMWALVERDLRKFFRSPALMMSSMIFPMVQLIVLGYAFGGKITHVKVGVVDQDHTEESWRVREAFAGVTTGPKMFEVLDYDSMPRAMTDLRAGAIGAIVNIPDKFSRRAFSQDQPRIGLIVDNTDQFTSSSLESEMQSVVDQLNTNLITQLDVGPVSQLANTGPLASRLPPNIALNIVEVYPYIEYVKYLLPGSIAMAIFIVSMIGGGITYIDDKSRGLHEGYLLTPIHKAELVLGLDLAGAIKGLMAGLVITFIGGLIAGIPDLWNPVRLFFLMIVVAMASLCMISFMFLMMVRIDDPLVPRAIFGVLNTLLFFPSGAIYPTYGFPAWLRAISIVDPFTYTVDALRNLLLRGSGVEGIWLDVLILAGFSAVMIAGSIALFKRQL
ncbi:MAG TPA: ABC transporter permease [Candidatus Acidoferrales bacterium]|nr:ABC transporter permease [Candidatus Acidoferrales bacterium]